MSQKSEPTVIGSLPHTRPQRRSAKRGARPEQEHSASKQSATAKKKTGRSTPKTEAAHKQPHEQHATCPPSLPDGTELVATAVKAAAELAEIGLTIGARALRIAISRLPRP